MSVQVPEPPAAAVEYAEEQMVAASLPEDTCELVEAECLHNRRSILKADQKYQQPQQQQQPQSPRKQPVRVEICEHRNKLIFYRQDRGWRLGYFSEHMHRRSQQAQQQLQQHHHHQQQHDAVEIPASRSGDHRQDATTDKPCRSPPSNQIFSPLSRSYSPPSNQILSSSPPLSQSFTPPANQRSLAAPRVFLPASRTGDLEISIRVIHACTSGCFAISS